MTEEQVNSANPGRSLPIIIGVVIYLLSTGPVAWAANNGYLPDEIHYIYLPLAPLMYIEPVGNVFFYYTVHIWHGFPYGYTTL